MDIGSPTSHRCMPSPGSMWVSMPPMAGVRLIGDQQRHHRFHQSGGRLVRRAAGLQWTSRRVRLRRGGRRRRQLDERCKQYGHRHLRRAGLFGPNRLVCDRARPHRLSLRPDLALRHRWRCVRRHADVSGRRNGDSRSQRLDCRCRPRIRVSWALVRQDRISLFGTRHGQLRRRHLRSRHVRELQDQHGPSRRELPVLVASSQSADEKMQKRGITAGFFVATIYRLREALIPSGAHPRARAFAAFSISVLPSDQIAPGTRCASAMTAAKDFSIHSQSASVMMNGGSSLIV